jgi:hypothetical protein
MSFVGRSLSLVTPSTSDEALALERPAFDAPPPRARPSERFEPWPIAEETARPLAEAAARRGLLPETAGPILIERALLEEDFAARRLGGMTVRLDELAARAEVEIELSEAQSAYLRALSRGSAKQAVAHPRLLPVPMRLTERLGEEGIAKRLAPGPLGAALLWERAAVLSGRTMSEWATLAMLEVAL